MDIAEGSRGKKTVMEKKKINLVWMEVKERYGKRQLILLTSAKRGEHWAYSAVRDVP